MKFKPDKKAFFPYIAKSFSFLVLVIVTWYGGRDVLPTGAWILTTGLYFVFVVAVLLYLWMDVGRTITLDSDGVTFSYLWIHRFYPWDAFAVKRLRYWDLVEEIRRVLPDAAEGVVFSVKPYREPIAYPHEPNQICGQHPFTSFFVFFGDVRKRSPAWYTPWIAEKTDFLNMLAQWGVELERF